MAGRSTWSGWRTTWISGTPRRYRPLGARVRGELASSVVVSRTMPGSGAGQSGRPSTAAGRRPRTAAGRARLTAERLAVEYPGTAAELCELDFASPWQLLVATVLSAQTTDERVNAVTPGLFARFPEPEDLAVADSGEVEALIRPTGFFRVKAKNIVALAQALCDRFNCEVPPMPLDVEQMVLTPALKDREYGFSPCNLDDARRSHAVCGRLRSAAVVNG